MRFLLRFAILPLGVLVACSAEPAPGGDHPDLSTDAFLGLEAGDREVDVGEGTTVTVHMQNLPMFAYHMFTSPDEYFALVATSSDGGRVNMVSASESQLEVKLFWPEHERGPHPTQNPADTCEGPGGNVEQEHQCVNVCCTTPGGTVTGMMPSGQCGIPALSLPRVDECIFGLDRTRDASKCCLEHDRALVCCQSQNDVNDTLTTRDNCILQPGGVSVGIANCPNYLQQLNNVASLLRRFVLIDEAACVGTTDYGAFPLPAEQCLCCEDLTGNPTRQLSIAELCGDSRTELGAEACFDPSCTPDEDRTYNMFSCQVACCELPGGPVVVQDHLMCMNQGGTDLGFQSERCPLTSDCCHQDGEYEWVSGLQVGRGSAPVRITGIAPGTVTLALRQVTIDAAPVEFRDFPSTPSTITIKVNDTGGGCVPFATDVGGTEDNPVIWEESYTCVDSSGNCLGEERVRVTLALSQDGKDVDWEIVEGTGIGSEYTGELCDTSFVWSEQPGTAPEDGCWEFTSSAFNKRSYSASFKCVGTATRGAGSTPPPAPTCADLANLNLDYTVCPMAPPASPIEGGTVDCDGTVITMPMTNGVACTPPDVGPCAGCNDYCLDDGFPMGSDGETCEGGFCLCGCTYCRPN